MTMYRDDRIEALNAEADKVNRILDRAIVDEKPIDEVFYALRIDWLQGVYISGTAVEFDDSVYDLTVFDDEFNIFTYDIGHGKGHGHTNQANMSPGFPGQGYVIGDGQGARNMADGLRGAPGPVDGKTRRYDRQTLSGGRNDYGLGVAYGQRQGSFGYNQAAATGAVIPRGSTVGTGGAGAEAGAAPSRRTASPTRRTRGGRPTGGATRRTASRRPARQTSDAAQSSGYGKTASISRRSSYDDYQNLPGGGYSGYGRATY